MTAWLAEVPTVAEVKARGLRGPAGLASSWPQGGQRVRVPMPRGADHGAHVLAVDGDRAVIHLDGHSLIGTRLIADLTP